MTTTPARAALANPSNTHLGVSSGTSTPTVKNLPGYTTPIFTRKDEQRKEVEASVSSKGFMPPELVKLEVGWFYDSLGIDDTYFANETVSIITDHILALFGAKIMAFTQHDANKLVIDLEQITPDGDRATFIHTSAPGVTSKEGPGATCEARIDAQYLDESSPEAAYRLETYRSGGSISATASQQLRCYFVQKCHFPPANAKKTIKDEDGVERTDIRTVSDKSFLEKATDNTLEIYQQVMWNVEERYGPVIEMFEVEGTRERRVVIGYRMGGTKHFFSALSDLYHFYGLYSARKYVEQFANGVTIVSLYLNPLPNSNAPPIEHSIHQVIKETSLLYCLPDNPFFRGTTSSGVAAVSNIHGSHAVQEATYAYAGWIFAQHFCNRLGPSYSALRDVLDESNAVHAEVLNNIKVRFREETFTRESIGEIIAAYPELIRMLYVNFAMSHYPAQDEASQLMPTLSYQRLHTEQPLSDEELYDKLRRTVPNKHELQVLESFLIFNKHILKTNFYQPTKVALSFRLAPNFLPEVEYPKQPFGMFFVIGSEFRGFHIRFRDVARGGIRIVRSRNKENYSINQRMLFDENYALAATQTLKNKDIPESGAKGTILPSLGAAPELCFQKYVDAIVDLLIPGHTPGIKEPIVDLYGEPELLFFGPDEGTADLMDWAANHARSRGAPWWKSFTTGKSAEMLGGVPHDTYGMTSLSVRQYILAVYKQMGLREKDVTKVQTGGPDGDLGSNEILLSSDKTVAVIDGSGVLADPAGLDRTELVRLAKARKMISNFDKSKLSKDGYVVLCEQHDVKLPSGEVIADGTDFRNNAHLRFKADIFVPCGGRPEAINISNVARLIDHDGKPHFKYIVEGANLFITQQARLYLEKRRVVLFKDSSANKGGVTSSSLEVLAGLGLSDSDYIEHMIFKDGKPSPFYESYVKDIQAIISSNASLEAGCIQREFQRLNGSKPRTLISDELSSKLNDLQAELESSDLFDDVASRRGVLSRAIPQTLVKQVGIDALLERLPEPYQRALFSSWVAAHFIYKYGVNGTSVNFFNFARTLAEGAEAKK
ncbi:glutamate dehydrogenase (NAD+) [Rhizoctonia solani AG-3 Rhs1AP]|uniref:NAD-specific glutamate dehydrogenase n=2 Tax=Rhizoctonia solani AG-3 TaxID=1086053 RepID=A0A074SCS5_9AGAM|nr:glutamate dehydrogenase (NAD+) [Rhizoctonia solani AG-3 Rhs1AP]KEP47817.1 glutamate dehydrogenase (NAD+) [Rhizoctonia solani 123E]